jgi:hypothetical protein
MLWPLSGWSQWVFSAALRNPDPSIYLPHLFWITLFIRGSKVGAELYGIALLSTSLVPPALNGLRSLLIGAFSVSILKP